MVKPIGQGGSVDLSFMPSLQCDLECGHCMYDSSPFNLAALDLDKTRQFVETVDWQRINACGFYGGEPGIKLDLYSQFIELIPLTVPRFTITDGTWSRTPGRTAEFVAWAQHHLLQVYISSTKYHTPHQNEVVLQDVALEYGFTIKGDDDVIPMGRMARVDWTCTRRCERWEGPVRFAVQPGGSIVFQNCDGVYPVVSTYRESFQHLLDTYEATVSRCQEQRNVR